MRLAPSLLAVGLSLATCAAHAAPVSGPVALRPLTSSTVHPDVLQSANALVVLALKDKRVVVAGPLNKTLVGATRVSPRGLLLRTVCHLQGPA